jgi:hypothetical protein
VVSFTSGRINPKERAPGTHWIGGWVGPRAVLDAVVKRKIRSKKLGNMKTEIKFDIFEGKYIKLHK